MQIYWRLLAIVVLLIVGCSPRKAGEELPPISDKPLSAGDKVTHVSGEPVKGFADLTLKTATADGEAILTVERKDGRIERVVIAPATRESRNGIAERDFDLWKQDDASLAPD